MATSPGFMREWVEQYGPDRQSLLATYRVAGSPARRHRLKEFHQDWLLRLASLNYDQLAPDDQTEYHLLLLQNRHALHELEQERALVEETRPWLGFADTIYELAEARRRREPVDPPEAARRLDRMARDIQTRQREIEVAQAEGGAASDLTAIVANRAADEVQELSAALAEWFNFYHGYDPLFTWWATAPYREAERALTSYQQFLREEVAEIRPGRDAPIIGTPIGLDALTAGLRDAMIAYTPLELLDIADREMAWCEREMVRAAHDLGVSSWHEALERVKNSYVPPGDQPAVIYALAAEGIKFAEAHGLVTIPPLAKETWRSEMMSPERQRINPFFLGGQVIRMSYPTDSMTYDERLMSMRGNNPYFSRSTVFHELLPGHYLQQFVTQRVRPHRRVFSNPFWTEGFAFYWEMLFWDLGFNETPEQRIGMLFWRMHRAARVLYTLGFHLGRMSTEDAVALLVDRVGHELDNARGEVRRLFLGNYPPLYQCAYLVGALQFRALHHELVDSGRMTNQAFHDAVLEQNYMPIELLRSVLTGERLAAGHQPSWRFYEQIASPPRASKL